MKHQIIRTPEPISRERLARILARLIRQRPTCNTRSSAEEGCGQLGAECTSSEVHNHDSYAQPTTEHNNEF